MKTKEALQQEKYSIYTGTTKRGLKDEADQFLNRRGYNNFGKGKVRKPYKGQRQRPVLLSKCTRCRLNAQERKAIGIKSAFVFTRYISTISGRNCYFWLCFFTVFSKLRYNCNEIEDRLQRMIAKEVCNRNGQIVPLGLRLHRWVACGSNLEDPDRKNEEYLAKVYFTVANYEKVVELCVINK